jgi:hypothetical protein
MARFRPRASFGLLRDFLRTTTDAVVGLFLDDAGGPPTLAGELVRHGADLKWHDGAAAHAVVLSNATQTVKNKTLADTVRVGFSDQAADPTTAGTLQRHGDRLKWHTGTSVEALAYLRDIGANGVNLPAIGGAAATQLDLSNETWVVLEFPNAGKTVADFPMHATAFSTLSILWRTPSTTGNVKWFAEVRAKSVGGSLGDGAPVVSGSVVAAAAATANRLVESTIALPYTPGASDRVILLRVYRDKADAADTLGAVAQIVWTLVT